MASEENIEVEQKVCGFKVKNRRIFYLGLFIGGIFFMSILIIALAGDSRHPAIIVLYTLLGVLAFFVILLVGTEYKLFSLPLSKVSKGGMKKSVELATEDGQMTGCSEIPYSVDTEMAEDQDGLPSDSASDSSFDTKSRPSTPPGSLSNEAPSNFKAIHEDSHEGGVSFSVDITASSDRDWRLEEDEKKT